MSCPLCVNLPCQNKIFPAFPVDHESYLGQFSALPRCLNILMYWGSDNWHVFSKPPHYYWESVACQKYILRQVEINTAFWDDFYHIMEWWTNELNTCVDSSEVFLRKTKSRERKMHPYFLALLISRSTSFLFCSSGEVGVVREKGGVTDVKWEFNSIRISL